MSVLATSGLALHGGTPVRSRPLPPWPVFDAEMTSAVTRVLLTGRVNYWTGEEGRCFEAEYAEALGRRHGVALANGTVALELALRALGVGPGAEVVVPARTFLATASAVVAVGARPVFADVDRDSQNVTVETLLAALTPRTRALIVVHLAGWPADLPAIIRFAREQGLRVVEDCAQAHGATVAGRPVGSFGDAAAFSFCQDKIITTAGEGGLLVLDDDDAWRRAWAYKDHGKSYAAVHERDHPPGFRWLHESWGTNWRLTEVQAAVGRIALRRLPGWVTRRRALAARLLDRLGRHPALRVPVPDGRLGHSYYKAYAFLDRDRLRPGWDRDSVMAAISAEGVPCLAGSCSEIYLEGAVPLAWRPEGRLPVARALGEAALMFLVHPTLSEDDIDDVGTAVDKVLGVAAG